MRSTYYIEKSILASALNSEIQIEIKKDYFSTEFHRKLAAGINRLKELGEYIDFELLRNKFIKAHKWSIQEDEMLIDIMTSTTPFATKQIAGSYLDILKEESKMSLDKRFAI